MKHMKCVIVDDDEVSLNILTKQIEVDERLTLLKTFCNAADAFSYLQQNRVDLAFVDVELGDYSGIELINKLMLFSNSILISSYTKYAVDAFDMEVPDFLLKPITAERFSKAVNRFISGHTKPAEIIKKYYYVRQGQKLIQIDRDTILFVEAMGAYVKIHTASKKYVFESTMKSLEDSLQGEDFMRVHRSYIVRLDKINEIESGMLRIGEHKIPISRLVFPSILSRIRLL
jgi:DNA-binding LytR/AlgR family response regulator